MAATFATLACCLLAFSSALTTTGPPPEPGRETAALSSSAPDTDLTEGTTEGTSPHQTPATAALTATAEVTTLGTRVTTVPATTGGDAGTTVATVASASSSDTVSTTTLSENGTADATRRLTGSEKYITVVLSVTLGLVLVVLSVYTLSKCRNTRQFGHQRLQDSGDMRTFASDDDTLVISGGLYDAHPIYDFVPTESDNQPEHRLEFYR